MHGEPVYVACKMYGYRIRENILQFYTSDVLTYRIEQSFYKCYMYIIYVMNTMCLYIWLLMGFLLTQLKIIKFAQCLNLFLSDYFNLILKCYNHV